MIWNGCDGELANVPGIGHWGELARLEGVTLVVGAFRGAGQGCWFEG